MCIVTENIITTSYIRQKYFRFYVIKQKIVQFQERLCCNSNIKEYIKEIKFKIETYKVF